jgi:hypothetical protein
MVLAVTCRPLTEDTRFRSQSNSCRICCRRSGTGRCFSPSTSTVEIGKKTVIITGAQCCGKESGVPTVLHIFFSFSVVSLVVDCTINPFRPSPVHTVAENQSFRYSVKIFRRFAIAGGPEEIFHRVPNPLSTAMRVLTCAPSVSLHQCPTHIHSSAHYLNSTADSVVK